jgi:hypothetical protein
MLWSLRFGAGGEPQGVDYRNPSGRGGFAAVGAVGAAIRGSIGAARISYRERRDGRRYIRAAGVLCAICIPVDITFLWRPTLRDADDEMVLETAVNGRADRLLTFNERDFIGAEKFGIAVVRPRPAWGAWRNR